MTTTYTKVFVGNLSFKTKADELAAEFSQAGKVVSANIITRGPRSLGYGFVEMEKEEDAHKAVALLNKKSVDGRDINVEVARERDEAKMTERRERRQQDREANPEGTAARSDSRRRRAPRGPRGPRPDGDRKSENAVTSSPAEGQDGEAKPVRGRGRRQSRRSTSRKPVVEGAEKPAGDSPSSAPRTRKPRGPRRAPRDNSARALSTTTIFVANLPFTLTDEGLSALFEHTKPVKAHIVMNRNGRSKGFGFVEYATEEQQVAAISASEGLVSETRPLSVKIALTPPVIAETSATAETPKSETA